jgi:HK97 family phage portal protein
MNRFQNFIQRLAGVEKKEIPKPPAYIPFNTNTYGALTGYGSLESMKQEELLRQYKSWVYAAVTKRSDEFSNLKLTLNKIVKKGKEQSIVPVTTHPLLELLDKVNPYLSFGDLLKITQTYKDLSGNAYWWIIREGNKVTGIWPYLRPDRMTVIPSAETFIEGYTYQVPGTSEIIKFGPDEIIQFKYPNPMDPYQGVSPMEACLLAFNTYLKSSEYNNLFFGNNARADFLLTFPNGLGEDEVKQIRAQWESRHRGSGHEHRFAIVSGDAKVQTIGLNQKDMEFIEQMKFTRDEILAIFKVPKALLDPQELNYASAQVAKEVFLNGVIVPLMKDMVQTLNEFLVPLYGDDSLFLDFEHPGEENPETKYLRYTTLAQIGAIAPNEIRAMENLPPFEGGDSVYLPMVMAPIGEAPVNQSKSVIGKIDKVKLPVKHNVPIKSHSNTAELREQITDEIAKSIREKNLARKKKVTPPPQKIKTQKQLFNEAFWYSKIAKTDIDEREMRKKLSKEFNRQQKQVLASLKEKTLTIKFDEDYEAGVFVDIFTPFYTKMIKLYGDDAMDMIGMSGFNMSDRAKDWLSDNVDKFATDVNATTAKKIRTALETAVEEGEGIPEASKRIKEVFVEANTSRANAIARTEVTHSSNYASVEAWKQSGVVEKKEWLTAMDETVCEICDPLNGKTMSLDNEFGSTDELFGSVEEPPAHVNCRCTVLPVIKTKSQLMVDAKTEAKQEIKKEVEQIKQEATKEIEGIKEIKRRLHKAIENE